MATPTKPDNVRKDSRVYEYLAWMIILPKHPTATMILRFLAEKTNNSGTCFPSYALISAVCGGASPSTISAALDFLYSLGVLTLLKRGSANRYTKANSDNASKYQLHKIGMRRLVVAQGVFNVDTTRCVLHGNNLTARIKELSQDAIFSAVVAKAMDSRDCDDRTQQNSRSFDEPSSNFDERSRNFDENSSNFDENSSNFDGRTGDNRQSHDNKDNTITLSPGTLYIQPSTMQPSMKEQPSTKSTPLLDSPSRMDGGVQACQWNSAATSVPLEPSMIEDSKSAQCGAQKPAPKPPAPEYDPRAIQYLEFDPESMTDKPQTLPGYGTPGTMPAPAFAGTGVFKYGIVSAEQDSEE